MSKASDAWYVRLPDGRVVRASSTGALRKHIGSGRIAPDSHVRRSPEQEWLSLEEAVLYYATGQVLWEAGSQIATLHGGHNAKSGLRSEVTVNSIIGVNGMGRVNPFDIVPSLSNSKLFQRDRGICGYCGDQFHNSALEREHVVPLSRGGRDSWMNVVASCRPCNQRKGARLPEEAAMPLIYAPYIPSLWEDMILRNRTILSDQMAFLAANLPRGSRLHG